MLFYFLEVRPPVKGGTLTPPADLHVYPAHTCDTFARNILPQNGFFG